MRETAYRWERKVELVDCLQFTTLQKEKKENKEKRKEAKEIKKQRDKLKKKNINTPQTRMRVRVFKENF